VSFDRALIDFLIDQALAEDIGQGDITSKALIDDDIHFRGVLAARQEMVVAGLEIALSVFQKVAQDAVLTPFIKEGALASPGDVLAEISGAARALLSAERTALNILQHLSGIATLTRAYVKRIEGSGVVLLDTRKTIPGLRVLAKYATALGGAQNHRMGLDDAVLIKDNHIALCGGVGKAVLRAKDNGLSPVEVECDTLNQVREALEAGAEILLLDNMMPETLKEAATLAQGRAKTEASGGVTLETIAEIAQSGVDYISVGAITQSAPAIDIGLDWSHN
jgi:nicotinate-nucleotide pyrophosphorylase (carboxylating)